MLNVALYEPEIPPNTGNIIRLCANTGAKLHLIEPLGFELDTKRLRRAGLDYHEWAEVHTYPTLQTLLESLPNSRVLALTTKAKNYYHQISYQENDILLFGPETRGLPNAVLDSLPTSQRIRIPQQASSRSLNLSNSVSIVLYEALRQHHFPELL